MHVMALFPSFKETTNKCPRMLKLKPVTLSLPNLLCSKAMGMDPFRLSRCHTATTNQSRLQSSTFPPKRM